MGLNAANGGTGEKNGLANAIIRGGEKRKEEPHRWIFLWHQNMALASKRSRRRRTPERGKRAPKRRLKGGKFTISARRNQAHLSDVRKKGTSKRSVIVLPTENGEILRKKKPLKESSKNSSRSVLHFACKGATCGRES